MRISPGFIFGLIVGAALALLFAPGPGDETRERLSERARQYWDEA